MARRPTSSNGNRRSESSARTEMSEDEQIIQEAFDRFKRAEDWEAAFWVLYTADVKFANADSDNGWQWPDDLRKDRETNKRPTLTINKVKQLCNLITNDARQNKPSISIKPATNEASFDAAQIFEGLIRQIEYASGAQMIYDEATDSQVEGGIGYWRVLTRPVSDDTFDQEPIIAPVPAHRNVYLDCDIKQRDGSDAEWGFIFDDLPDEEAKRQMPEKLVGTMVGFTEGNSWTRDGYTRVAEYYRIVKTEDELIWLEDDNGTATTFKRSEAPKDIQLSKLLAEATKADPDKVKRRKIFKRHLEWYKIAGNQIVDRRTPKENPLFGSYIPIARVVFTERVIDGKLERKGHVRGIKDAQRMYNYNSSGQVEFGALQTKSPWVGAAAAFQGNEVAWNNANRSNAAYLTFRHKDADGNDLPPQALPQRPQPPGASPVFVQGMEIADREMMMASGQHEANQGMQGNERSGKAINERQRQGDKATYHAIDNLAIGVRYTGKILLDLIPKLLDTERVATILGRDGTQTKVQVKPQAKEAYQKVEQEKDDVSIIFNPTVGKYEVQSDVGPAYATQRQEAWNAFVQIVQGAPELINVIGDYMFQSADFPLADKIAERIRNKIRNEAPWLLDDEAPGPAIQQLKQQLEQATQQVAELLEQLSDTKRALKSKDQKRDIDAYRAETGRVKDFGNTIKDVMDDPRAAEALSAAFMQTVRGMFGEDITDVVDAQQDREPGQDGEHPSVPGARKAPDGKYYLPDPQRPGKFLQVNDQQRMAA